MKAMIKKEMNRISTALENFKNAESEFIQTKQKYKQLQEDFANCKKSLKTSISITR